MTPETSARLREIRKRIFRLQNGGNIESLQNMGINTTGQIGASFVSLKKLAADYEPDEELATLLWFTHRREEQIMACLLLPKKINKEKITQLIKDCYNEEIAEYFGSLFLCHSGELPLLAEEWSDSRFPFQQIALLTAGARHFILYKSNPVLSRDLFKTLVNKEYENKYVNLVARRYRKNGNS